MTRRQLDDMDEAVMRQFVQSLELRVERMSGNFARAAGAYPRLQPAVIERGT